MTSCKKLQILLAYQWQNYLPMITSRLICFIAPIAENPLK
nr:MAG TPA: hypothetical protein [Caudoviricetes sp.]